MTDAEDDLIEAAVRLWLVGHNRQYVIDIIHDVYDTPRDEFQEPMLGKAA